MRPKFVITLVVGAALIITLAVVAKFQLSPTGPAPARNAESVAVATPAEPAPAAEPSLPPLPPLPDLQVAAPVPTNPVVVAELSADERAAKIAEDIMRINAVIGEHDSNSVALILCSLTNAEQEVRDQAVAAVKQLGDRDLIPALTNLAATIEDYEQRHALLAAAEFLSLPTLSEVQATMTPSATPYPKPAQRPHPPRILPAANPNGADPNAPQPY